MGESNPYNPPKVAQTPIAPGASNGRLAPAILLGAVVALVAMLFFGVVAGLLFTLYALPDNFASLTHTQRHNVMLDTPYVKLAVVSLWIVGMAVGGFFGARCCARKWLHASAGVASVYLVLWAVPSIVLAAGMLSATQWIQIIALVPAAVIGGYIARPKTA